ncbi:MAG: hypothetical protein LQ346_005262 [Caloplaca aetnensis]|nr:MAG: hypothetical protein LQ346_005262 [Caloplaca aetnensis]
MAAIALHAKAVQGGVPVLAASSILGGIDGVQWSACAMVILVVVSLMLLLILLRGGLKAFGLLKIWSEQSSVNAVSPAIKKAELNMLASFIYILIFGCGLETRQGKRTMLRRVKVKSKPNKTDTMRPSYTYSFAQAPGNIDPRLVGSGWTSFQHSYRHRSIFRQTGSKHKTGSAATDDDVSKVIG